MQNEIQEREVQALHILVAAKLYAPEEVKGPVAVVLEGNRIRAIWRDMDADAVRDYVNKQMPDAEVSVTDLGSWCLAPGYIDIHVHGFCGYDATIGSQEDVEAMARELPRTGVTSFFPTMATLDRAKTAEQILRVIGAAESQVDPAAAEILGLRLEGPFISRAKKGAQYEPGIRVPDATEMEEIAIAGRGWLHIIDYAPEEDTSSHFLAMAMRLGMLVCIGHTEATYDQAIRAIDGGARHSAHLFNAMSPLGHRAPGAPGALLTDHRATVEVIADGIHLHPAMLKLVVAARGTRDVALITDAVAPAGLPEGNYEFVGRPVIVAARAVRLANGTLAGSVLTLDQAVRNIMTFTGIGWSEAIGMATDVPARIADVAKRKGRITPGADADLIALDTHGVVQRTWIRGLLAYPGAIVREKMKVAN